MNYPELIAFFDECNAHYRSFLKFEYSKMNMIHKGEIEKLSASLNTEQAFIMKSNTLESKREKLTGSGKTFADIINEAPEEYKEQLSERCEILSDAVYKIKELNDAANVIITERLKKIRMRTGENDTYNGKGDIIKDSGTGKSLTINA